MRAIRIVNWNSLDLNLLRVLDAMLHERNTTRVGERIGLSQPAVSAALKRLRQVLDNPLFVREGNRMVPTPLAESLEEPLRQALARIERTLSGGAPFDPARSTRLFRLAGDDYLSETLLPGLMALLSKRAPGIRFQVLPTNPNRLAQQLAESSIDMAVLRADEEPPDWMDHALALHASPTVVACKRNKRLTRAGVKDRETIPIGLFCDMPHVFFSPEGKLAGREDAALAKIGRQRRIVLTVPDFFSVARVVAQTQLLGLIPDRFAHSVASQLGLRIYALPFKMPLVPLALYWHRRHTSDAEHRWMRERILELLEPLDALRHPVSLAGDDADDRVRPAARPSRRSRKGASPRHPSL
ncbi:MAG: LysR family transcriptional regulator [Bauldia sp.]